MTLPKSIGLPRMVVETGEKRVFLPEFVEFLNSIGLHVYIEEGYGSRLGYTFDDFRRGSENVHQCNRTHAFSQDLILILRAPKREEFRLLKQDSILISMLHFPTRPGRVEALILQKINAISLDSIIDDFNVRRIENMPSVAWNGLEIAFDLLEKKWPKLIHPENKPINILIIGTGMVGKYAVEAGTKLGNVERYNDHLAIGGFGAVCTSIGRATTSHPEVMMGLLQSTDILVDATQRRNPSYPVVPNAWIANLPDHAIIVDLSVDPYLPNNEPPIVRGIEGIPQGNLDKYIFDSDDPDWCQTIPDGTPTDHRRTTVTCYSWPGIHPQTAMEHYARQLKPLIKVLVEVGYHNLSLDGDFFERALYRGTLKYFLENREI